MADFLICCALTLICQFFSKDHASVGFGLLERHDAGFRYYEAILGQRGFPAPSIASWCGQVVASIFTTSGKPATQADCVDNTTLPMDLRDSSSRSASAARNSGNT
jgi:hypothetical protein